MLRTRSQLEKRLARLLSPTPPLAASGGATRPQVDLIYLDAGEQERLERIQHP